MCRNSSSFHFSMDTQIALWLLETPLYKRECRCSAKNISLGIDIFSMIFIIFVLLKTLVFISPVLFEEVGYNWTLLELKCDVDDRFFTITVVIIEPCWNWNRWATGSCPGRSLVIIEPCWNWNIEHLDSFPLVGLVIIEPCWNWNIIIIK